MSGFVETLATSKIHPFRNKQEEEEEDRAENAINNKDGESNNNNNNNNIIGEVKNNDDQNDLKAKNASNLGPIICPKAQPNKDVKGTPRRKQRVLERLNTADLRGGRREADVQIEGMWIDCPGRPEIALSHPFISSPKACLFTLKEGTRYRLKFSFHVYNNVVSGLRYEHTLWKAGIRVDRSTVKLGTFNPQEQPHAIELEEETLPSGILFRGLYSARAKVIDDDGKCYMDLHYHFDIQKTWPSSS